MDPSIPVQENLARFADSLKVGEGVEDRGNRLLDNILKTVTQKFAQKSSHNIYRVVKAGSLGKKTAISLKVDYDCVFLIADTISRSSSEDFRSSFLDELEDVLTLHVQGVNAMGRTVNSIGFEKDGFSFDFLPALYVCQDSEEQVKTLATQCLSAGESEYKRIRTGLVEGTVLFMKEQSSFVHRLARLLKYWSHTVLVPGFFNGRSYTLELFSVLAGDEVRDVHGGKECLLLGFRTALVKIRDYARIQNGWDRFYNLDAAKVLHKKDGGGPMLLDVSDPRNNMLGADRLEFFDKLSEYAAVTLGRLDALCLGVPSQLVDLFDPQPKIWNRLRNVPKVGTYLVGSAKTMANGIQMAQPRVEARKKAKYMTKEMEMYAHAVCALMEREFFALPDKFKDENIRSRECQKLAERSLDTLFKGDDRSSWVSSSAKFEDKEVELILPVCRTISDMYVQIGFDVEENKEHVSFENYKESVAYWDDVKPSKCSNGGSAARHGGA